MKKYFLLCLLFLSSIAAPSQSSYLLKLPEVVKTKVAKYQEVIFFGREVRWQGERARSSTPWEKGILLTSTDDTLSVEVSFQAILDEVYLRTSQKILALYPQKVKAIAFAQKVYLPLEYEFKDKQLLGYFELLSEGEILLLKNPRVQPEKSKKSKYLYYIKKGNAHAVCFSPSVKNLTTLFPHLKKEIKTYIATQDLNLKHPKDLKKIFDYCQNNF